MSPSTRPFRSALYIPGSNVRAIEKAKRLSADVLILDLEDAVAPVAKSIARSNVVVAARAAADGEYGRRYFCIRTNALNTVWGVLDLEAAAQAAPDAILLPKVESATDVSAALESLAKTGLADKTRLWVMLETPLGILHAEEIAAASPRLETMVLGTTDLVKELHALQSPSRLAVMPSLAISILAARAHGLSVLDGVHLDLADAAGFLGVCRQGAELGFDGKTLIHPDQIGPANQVYEPSVEAVDFARCVILAYAEAEVRGEGVTLLDGKLIEALHVEDAQRIVGLAAAIERLRSD